MVDKIIRTDPSFSQTMPDPIEEYKAESLTAAGCSSAANLKMWAKYSTDGSNPSDVKYPKK